jgi:hypothetical protein
MQRSLLICMFLTIFALPVLADPSDSTVDMETSDDSANKLPEAEDGEQLSADLVRPPLIRVGKASFDLGIEYRLRNIYINPLQLNGLDAVEVGYGIQRLRTAWSFDWDDKVKIKAQIDFLDGVLFGDNGAVFGEPPYPNEGTSSAARWPNEAGIAVVLKEGGDPLDSNSYTYGLKKLDPVYVRRAWGEVWLGFGMLQAGRMPAHDGRNILGNDGDNDLNRFGSAGRGNTVDRILFGTKPIEIAKALISGDLSEADSRQDRGLFFGMAYDRLVDDAVQLSADDAGQFGTSAYYLIPEFDLFGTTIRDFKLSGAFAYRNSDDVQTDIFITPFELSLSIEDAFRLEFQAAVIWGKTREVSDALSLMSGRTPVVQDILGYGIFAIADYDLGPVTFTLEFDYASGDDDPRPEADNVIKDFFFAEDTKVGLLLFPQVLAYETACSAAAATATLKGLGATALPSTRVASGGAFTNAIALFPQVTWHITDDIYIRFGALLAWAAAPVTDPHETLLHEDGVSIEDDAVNYNGGPPGNYYGTEFDLRFSARLWGHFYFDLEGAILLPGDALQDEHGDAVMSAMAEARLTFRY